MSEDMGAPQADGLAGAKAPEPQPRLGPADGIPSADEWPFLRRLAAFAEDYCRKQPSLGMIGSMAWVMGVEVDFHLVPRSAQGIEAEGHDAKSGVVRKDESPVGSADAPTPPEEPTP